MRKFICSSSSYVVLHKNNGKENWHKNLWLFNDYLFLMFKKTLQKKWIFFLFKLKEFSNRKEHFSKQWVKKTFNEFTFNFFEFLKFSWSFDVIKISASFEHICKVIKKYIFQTLISKLLFSDSHRRFSTSFCSSQNNGYKNKQLKFCTSTFYRFFHLTKTAFNTNNI